MEKWLESVYSDGTDQFVSNPQPNIGDKVKLSIRFYEDAPVEHVLLRYTPNGSEHLLEAKKEKTENGLVYYSVEIPVNQDQLSYNWYLVGKDKVHYYNQKGVTNHFPDNIYDFKLLANYEQPEWVKESVFYQIFPERFYNGNPDNDVRDNEYSVNGHPTIQMKNWNETPLEYQEGFCMDFYGGDLEGIKEKIPYLKELGIDTVYLNPIFTAPSVHKYDCIDYLEVDPHFGGNEALAALSEELHKNGMKLILDVSINHTGSNHKWFNRDGIFFEKEIGAFNNPDSEERNYYFIDENNNYHTWAGVQDMPELNYTSDELRKAVYLDEDSVVKKWLKPPYNIDGWRFDVADTFARKDEYQLAHEIWPEIRKSIREENDQAYILAEDWDNCYQYQQGDEWDSPMNYYGSARPLRQFVGEQDLFSGRNPILNKVKYKMPAEEVEARITQYLAKLPYLIQQNQFNLLDSHDVSRLHNNPEVHPEEYKGAVMMLFSLIGAPSIYYGDELEIDGTIYSNEGCRFPMPWNKDYKELDFYNFYKKLIELKKTNEAFTKGGMKFLFAQGNILALARFYKNNIFITVMSVSDKPETVTLPLGSLGSKGPVEETDIFGNKINFKVLNDKDVEFTLEPHQAFIIDCSVKND